MEKTLWERIVNNNSYAVDRFVFKGLSAQSDDIVNSEQQLRQMHGKVLWYDNCQLIKDS